MTHIIPRHMKPFAGPNDGEFASTDPIQAWTQIEIGANTLALGRWHVDTTPQGQSDCIAHVSIAGVGSRTRPNDPPGSSGGPSDCLRIITKGTSSPWFVRSAYPVDNSYCLGAP